jgi:hypothetical protein
MYVNPGVAMLDVVANTEPGGFGGINSMLAQLRGDAPNLSGEVVCQGDVCMPVDQFGNPVAQAIGTGSGYWWPRVSLTFVLVAALLTLASTRLVVPAGMRWAFRRPRRPGARAPTPVHARDDDGAPTITDMREEPEA